MKTTRQIAAMSTEEIKTSFFHLINDVVTHYGDNQRVACPGQEEASVSLPGNGDDEHQEKPVQFSQAARKGGRR